jgi:hypothetical protein
MIRPKISIRQKSRRRCPYPAIPSCDRLEPVFVISCVTTQPERNGTRARITRSKNSTKRISPQRANFATVCPHRSRTRLSLAVMCEHVVIRFSKGVEPAVLFDVDMRG